ncbi:hypothetical protein DFQ27_009214 [Actinomortierella ambigua]|uniref:CCHC-type domain-containing protein n=1 Tax=Actinomortierella ambigua TaxID=1343610 RepID=A0A9P6TXI1_9FUNG|nr:hypothetical protein DFQ27_009214 [Actinomortierella ambigua]
MTLSEDQNAPKENDVADAAGVSKPEGNMAMEGLVTGGTPPPALVDPIAQLTQFRDVWQAKQTAALSELTAFTVQLDASPTQPPSETDLQKKNNLTRSEDFFKGKVSEYNRLLASHGPPPEPTNPSSTDGWPAYMGKHNKVTLDVAIPRFGPKGSVTPTGTILLSSPLEFLEKFHTQAQSIYPTQLDAICAQLLILAMMDDTQQRRLQREFHQLGGNPTWATCERVFTDTLMTEAEQLRAAKKAIRAGMLPGESFERYAWRLERMVRVYKICESPSHSTLLGLMQVTIPSSVLASMNLWFSMATVMNLVKAPTPSSDDSTKRDIRLITRADEFYLFLERMPGPDDCDDRKRVLLGDDDDDSTSRSFKRARHGDRSNVYCKNGCGWNPTHDSTGCVLCSNCKTRGHYADDCRKERVKLSPPVPAQASHNGNGNAGASPPHHGSYAPPRGNSFKRGSNRSWHKPARA